MTDTTETARALLWRHNLPEDVIDGALALHAQELAAVQRKALAQTDDPVFYEGEAGWLVNLIDPALAEDAPASVVVPAADRAALSARLWKIAEHHIVAEWICCEPLQPGHDLCAQGYTALGMVKTLLVDGDPEKAWNPSAPLLDAVLGLPAPADRAAEERLARVLHWVTSDVVTAQTEFGSGYRAAQRDIRDLIRGRFDADAANELRRAADRGPAVEAQPGKDTETPQPKEA